MEAVDTDQNLRNRGLPVAEAWRAFAVEIEATAGCWGGVVGGKQS